jgi:AcrR family transcriptional regulator
VSTRCALHIPPIRALGPRCEKLVASTRSPKRKARRLGRPPGQLSEDTRRAILVAARRCFVRLGFDRATNRDIAEAAGLTAAAMYRHFESKPDLYVAVVHDAMADLLPRLERASASNAGAKTVVRTMLEMFASMDEREQSAAHFLGALPSEMQRHPQVAQRMLADPGRIYAALNDAVATSVRTGELAKDKAQRAVPMIIAAMMGISAYANTLGPALGREAIAGFLDLLDNRLFSAGAAGAAGAEKPAPMRRGLEKPD